MKTFASSIALTLLISTPVIAIDKVIYGTDNRVNINSSNKQQLVDSVAAMIPGGYFHKKVGKDYVIPKYRTLEWYRGAPTCKTMKFRQEPTISACSGFLIGPDLLMTAGHCVTEANTTVKNQKTTSCANNRWVFNYTKEALNKKDELVFAQEDVYKCKNVISASYTTQLDFAVIKLEKVAVGKKSLKIAKKSSKFKVGNEVYVAGFPTGLPLKISAGAQIVKNNPRSSTFITNLDTFAGNSGAPVLNNKDEVVGILVSGEIDYYWNYEKQCVEVNICKGYNKDCDKQTYLEGGSGERVTKITSAYSQYTLDNILKGWKFD